MSYDMTGGPGGHAFYIIIDSILFIKLTFITLKGSRKRRKAISRLLKEAPNYRLNIDGVTYRPL